MRATPNHSVMASKTGWLGERTVIVQLFDQQGELCVVQRDAHVQQPLPELIVAQVP